MPVGEAWIFSGNIMKLRNEVHKKKILKNNIESDSV